MGHIFDGKPRTRCGIVDIKGQSMLPFNRVDGEALIYRGSADRNRSHRKGVDAGPHCIGGRESRDLGRNFQIDRSAFGHERRSRFGGEDRYGGGRRIIDLKVKSGFVSGK